MQGQVAGRFMDSHLDNLGRMGEAAHLGSSRIFGDLLSSQDRTNRAIGDISTNLFGGAYDRDQNRALSAAGLGLGAGQSAYDSALSSAARAQALAPTLAQMGLMPFDIMNQVGAQRRGLEQMGIDEAMSRHQFEQNAPFLNLQQYASLLQNPGGGTQTTTGPGGNPLLAGLGGAATGAGIGGALGSAAGIASGAANPYMLPAILLGGGLGLFG